jgi:WD40 repeat protein
MNTRIRNPVIINAPVIISACIYRNLKEEVQTFRGHKKEASAVAWHPIHEGAFASGGSDGSIFFWSVGAEKEIGVIEQVTVLCGFFYLRWVFLAAATDQSSSGASERRKRSGSSNR